MKRSTLKKLRILCTACFAFVLFGISALFAGSVLFKATAESRTLSSTAYQASGASIRIFKRVTDENDEISLEGLSKKGIRFHVETGAGYEVAAGVPLVNVNETNEENNSFKLAEGYKTYTLVIPTRLLNGEELSLATSKVMKLDTTKYWFSDENGNWESVGYVYNVPENMYTDNFTFRGIICKVDGETETVIAATDPLERSLTYVAKMAYKDTIDPDSDYWGSNTLDEQAADLIKPYVPAYEITYSDSNNNVLGSETVLWGDKPENIPSGAEGDTWYDTFHGEEANLSAEMTWTSDRNLTLVTTASDSFVLTGVAAHSHSNGYTGVKVYATLPAEKFANNTEFDIKAVKVTHSGSGTYNGLAGVWAMGDGSKMRLFFGFKEGTALTSGDTLTVSADSVFYANGIMYKLTKDYVINYDGVDYGMFLGYLNNGHVKAIYNAPEDTDKDGVYDEFTIRVEFYDDIMITDEYTFVHSDSTSPVYIQCGQDVNIKHVISGGQYYWVADQNSPDGYTKILEMIGTGEETNMAYGRHTGDELHGLAGTKLVQNGGYYIFEDAMYARFLPDNVQDEAPAVKGVWTVGVEGSTFGSAEFAKFGVYVANDGEVRFETNNPWFETVGVGSLTLENTSNAENAAYYTSVDGTVTPLNEFVYHGYNGFQIFGIRGVSDMQIGDTITITAGTRLWYKQKYHILGDLNGETLTKDLVFAYNGREWFSGYDANNNVSIDGTDVSWISHGETHAEVRIWLNAASKTLTTTRYGSVNITGSPVLYNGATRTTGLHYGSGSNLVSFDTGVTTAKEGDHFIIPEGSAWWTLFYADQEVNRAVFFNDTVEATFNGSDWVSGNHQATFDYVGGNFAVSGIEKGYLYQGNNYTFTVTPASGHVIMRVLINGVAQPKNASNTYSFIANATNTLAVETAVGHNITFSVPVGAAVNYGAITNGHSEPVQENATFTFNVNASTGYKIVNVSNATNNGDGTYTVTADADKTVEITTEKLYKVTYSGAGVSFAANVSSGAWVDNGTTVTFTSITANSGYTLMSVSGATKNSNGTYTATVNGADLNVTATAVANSSLTYVDSTLGLEYRGWVTNQDDLYAFGLLNNGAYLEANAQIQGYWNDNGVWYAPNNKGVDIMDYILIDGVSARTLVTNNKNGETSYSGTTFPLNMGKEYAPVAVETCSTANNGLWIKVLKSFKSSFEITIKAGFTLIDKDGAILYLREDLTYFFGGALGNKVNEFGISVNPDTANVSGVALTQEIVCGQTYTFTVTAKTGYQVTSVTSDQTTLTNHGNGKYSFTAGVTAVYVTVTTAPLQYKVTVNTTNAKIEGVTNGQQVEYNQKLTITASLAHDGCENLNLKVDGATNNGDGTYTVTGNVTVTATANLKQYTVKATAGYGITITSSSTQQVAHNGSVTFTLTLANANGATIRVGGTSAGTGTLNGTSYTYTLPNVTADTTIHFSVWYQVTVSTNNSRVGNIEDRLYEYNEVIYPKVDHDYTEEQTFTINGNPHTSGNSYTIKGPTTIYASSVKKNTSCLVEGTLVTLADGTQKAVENIVAGDKVMVFNHETGKYEAGTIWFNDHANDPATTRNIINLEFANGAKARLAYEHAYFDLDLMQYVFIREDNLHEFVGHRFVSATYNGTEMVQSETTLVKAYITQEFVKVYGPITEYHFNLISDDMLSAPSFNFDARGMINIFEYNEDLSYNQEKMQNDIDTYGVFTYEDFSAYMSYEDYCKAPIAYFKVAIGKGNLTWEQIELTLLYLAENQF